MDELGGPTCQTQSPIECRHIIIIITANDDDDDDYYLFGISFILLADCLSVLFIRWASAGAAKGRRRLKKRR